MTRRRKITRPAASKEAPARVLLPGRAPAIYLAALLLCVVVCFYPLLTYFFAQDDFTLMLKAWRDGWGAVADYFRPTPGVFRPLTKAVYFGSMYGTFGLNAAPYHVVSIVVHLVNTVLVFVLMGRLRVSRPAALAAATFFGLSVAFFHVLAWISCIQQLLGQLFMLSALVWGVEYARDGTVRAKWYSLGAYVLALMSAEQTFGVPVILLYYAWGWPGSARGANGLRRALVTFAPHLAVLAGYLLFMGVWKTAPRAGPYAFSFGSNVIVNLLTYVGWTLQFGATLPSRMQGHGVSWSIGHVFFALLIAYQLVRRRWRETALGVGYFTVSIFPTLFLSGHTFYLHTYIPSVGMLYLVALFADDVLELRWLRKPAACLALLGAVLAVMSVVSFVVVRKNEDAKMFDFIDAKRSFVLRRGIIAKNAYDDLNALKPLGPNIEKVYLVYIREDGDEEGLWNNDNVMAAIGWGSMIPLVYEKPHLETIFKLAGDAVPGGELLNADVFFYDDVGNMFPMNEQGRE